MIAVRYMALAALVVWLGGMIALRLALQHPERVRVFISCDSSLAVDHPGVLETIRSRQTTMQAASIEQRS